MAREATGAFTLLGNSSRALPGNGWFRADDPQPPESRGKSVVARFDRDGKQSWARQFGGSTPFYSPYLKATKLSVGTDGATYLVGMHDDKSFVGRLR